MSWDNIKRHKKPGFNPLFRRYIFRKTKGLTMTPWKQKYLVSTKKSPTNSVWYCLIGATMGGKLCFDKTKISKISKRTLKVVCSPCTTTFLYTGTLYFYFNLQFLQKANNIFYDLKLIICWLGHYSIRHFALITLSSILNTYFIH